MNWLKRMFAVAIVIAVLAFGAIFAIQNNELVTLDFVILPAVEKSAAFWVYLFFCVGGALGLLSSSVVLLSCKAKLIALKRKLQAQELELSKLRLSTSK